MEQAQKSRRSRSDFLITVKGIWGLLQGGDTLAAVYNVEEGLRRSKATLAALAHLKAQPGVAELIQVRYLPPPADLEALLQYPQGSLGYVYASHLKQAKLEQNFYRLVAVEDDTSYFFLRTRQTHDIWHVITGYGIDALGEMELKAFEFAQTRRPIAAVLIGFVILNNLFKSPETLGQFFDRIIAAYQLGTQAKPFFAQKWEEHWEKPLDEWRAELGLALLPLSV